MDIQDAWNALPDAVQGGQGPLPMWARTMAIHLPRTTAAMLQLDFAQRTQSPMEPLLRAKMRYTVAYANRCEYTKAIALVDMLSSGGAADDAKRIAAGPAAWKDDERETLRFAQELTLSASSIDDALFESLRTQYGDPGVASMVLLCAYGNFQDRIVAGLGILPNSNEPTAPLDIRFVPEAFQMQPIFPKSEPVEGLLTNGVDTVNEGTQWSSIGYEQLTERLAAQRNRKQRLPTPTWDAVAKKLPPSLNAKPTRIVWNLVCMGYVPELAIPWSITTRTMWAEAPQNRVFEELLFWVQTRSIHCNYCMGHCEMLLEVAGLSTQEIRDRLSRLASDDWSAFPESQQRAFHFARKLTKTPWDLTPQDYARLEQDLGSKQAMAIFFWLCRGLYMTRVSDGFQLQLETDNVFI